MSRTLSIVIISLIVFSWIDSALGQSPPIYEFSHSNASAGYGSSFFTAAGTQDNRYNTIRFTSYNDFNLYVMSHTYLAHTPFQVWEHVYFGDSGLTQNMTVNFHGAHFDSSIIALSGYNRTLETSQLNLDHVDLNTAVKLFFNGSDNQINLSNSGIYFTSQDPIFLATAPLTISAQSGDNYLKDFNGKVDASTTTINLHSGSTLLLEYCGSVSDTAKDYEKLWFYKPMTGTVDNATLKLHYSNVKFNSTAFNFTNSSTFEMSGSQTKAQFHNVSFDNSQIELGYNNTMIVDSTLSLADSSVTINPGSVIDALIVDVTGTSSLDGDGTTITYLKAGLFMLNDNATFNQNGSRILVDDFFLKSGSQLNIDDAYFQAKTSYFTGGTVNVTNSGWYQITGGFNYLDRVGTFNIDATSRLQLSHNAEILTHNALVFNNSGSIEIYGYLSGDGTFSGNGEVIVYETGQVNPGTYVAANDLIDTITFENAVTFTNNGAMGDQSMSQYYVNLDVVGGSASNDLLQYNDNDFDMTGLTSIKVETAGNTLTADDMHGKSFTVIASLDSGSTGSLITGGSYPTLIEGNQIPVLIDFTIGNNSTNGHDDVTFNAAKQGVSTLVTHPSVNTPNKTNGTLLLINASNNGNSTINTTLNTVTNSQFNRQVDTFHAEPFSSNMTISLEQSDVMLEMALDNAALGGGGTYSTKHDNAIDPKTRKRVWTDGSLVKGHVDGKNGLGDFKYNLSSLVIGTDLMYEQDSNVGVFAGIGSQKMDEHDLASQDFRGTTYYLGFYGYKDFDLWELRAAGGYGLGDHISKRYVQFGSDISGVNKAEYYSQNVYAGVRGRFKPLIDSDWLTISPEGSILVSHHEHGKIKEKGVDPLVLTIDSGDARSFITGVGLDAAIKPFGRTQTFYPITFVRYEHDWEAKRKDAHKVDAALTSHADQKYTFEGQNRGQNLWTMGLGLAGEINDQWQVSGGVVRGWNSHGTEYAFGLAMEYSF